VGALFCAVSYSIGAALVSRLGLGGGDAFSLAQAMRRMITGSPPYRLPGGLQIKRYTATSGQKLIFFDLRNADSPCLGSLSV
jgi:hypothetical protein